MAAATVARRERPFLVVCAIIALSALSDVQGVSSEVLPPQTSECGTSSSGESCQPVSVEDSGASAAPGARLLDLSATDHGADAVPPASQVHFTGERSVAPDTDELAAGATELASAPGVEEFLDWCNDMGAPLGLGGEAPIRVVVRGSSFNPEQQPHPKEDGIQEPPGRKLTFGVAAARGIKEGETVVELPLKMQVLSSRDGEILAPMGGGPPGGRLYREGVEESAWASLVALAAFLLRERAKRNASAWAPYIRSLPESVALPIFFQPESIAALEYEDSIQEAESYRVAFKDEYDKCAPEAIANGTHEEFEWALSIVTSRCFSLPPLSEVETGSSCKADGHGGEEAVSEGASSDSSESGGRESTSSCGSDDGALEGAVALLPVGDLFNHDTDNGIVWQRGKGGSVRFVAVGDIREGDEIFNSYGQRNNDHLLLSYGFVLFPNKYDYVLCATGESGMALLYTTVFGEGLCRAESSGMGVVGGEGTSDGAEGAAEQTLVLCGDVVREGNSAVIAEMESYGEWPAHPVYNINPGTGVPRDASDPDDPAVRPQRYSLWASGLLDPRLLVAFASLWWRESYEQEPNHAVFAAAALPFAWNLQEGPCEEMIGAAGGGQAEVEAMAQASAGLHAVVSNLLARFSSSLADDLKELDRLRACRDRGFPNEGGDGDGAVAHAEHEGLQCTADLAAAHQERELVLLFRISKKTILEEAAARLQQWCPDSHLVATLDAEEEDDEDEASDSTY